MRTRVISAAIAAVLLSATGPAFALVMVREVDVSVDIQALQNAKAAEHWTAIADDLENAIVGKLTDQISDKGAKVTVDIDEVELANSWQSATNVADSRLAGFVHITHDTDNSVFETYHLGVTFEQAGPFFPTGTDLTMLTTDSKEYYDGMVAAFADHVVTKLK